MAISPQQLTIYLYSAHRAVIFAIAQFSCFCVSLKDSALTNYQSNSVKTGQMCHFKAKSWGRFYEPPGITAFVIVSHFKVPYSITDSVDSLQRRLMRLWRECRLLCQVSLAVRQRSLASISAQCDFRFDSLFSFSSKYLSIFMSFRFYNVYFSSVNKTIAQGNISYVVLRHQNTRTFWP